MSLVLGIDAGGTKTLAASVDRSGALIALVSGTGLDPTREGDPRGALTGFIDRIADVHRIEAATLGLPYHGEIAGISVMQTEVARGRFGGAARVGNDVEIAHIGAFAGGEGVLCLAGTGSMAWARGPNGTARAGGFGDLIGDEGSAFWIGRRALALLACEADGRRPGSAFGSELASALGIDAAGLIDWTYGHADRRAAVAGVARHVSALAQAGDGDASGILRAAAAELALAVRAASRAAGLSDAARWACAGGVFADGIVRGTVSEALRAGPVESVLPPVGGAVLDAALRAGWQVDEGWIARLRDGLEQAGAVEPRQQEEA